MTRCSTRPVVVMSTTSSRSAPIGTSSTWRTDERASDGYCTTATWRVSEASRRTVRSTTSSRSTAPSRNWAMARCSAALIGFTAESRSTNRR